MIARVQIPAGPAGSVQELREAIAAFSAAKPSLAWAETYPGTLAYYLASAFREVWLQPSGTVWLGGFATHGLVLTGPGRWGARPCALGWWTGSASAARLTSASPNSSARHRPTTHRTSRPGF